MEEKNNQNVAKFDPKAVVDDLKYTTAALQKETQNLNSGITGIDEKLKKAEILIDKSLKELKESVLDARVGISPEDLKKLESYKDYFKHYKPVFFCSLFILVCSLGLSVFGAYSGMKYYKESVRTKEEIRAQVLQEINQDGNVIVEKSKWDGYVEQSQVLRAWQKSNPRDSESLTNYFKGYQDFKKGNK